MMTAFECRYGKLATPQGRAPPPAHSRTLMPRPQSKARSRFVAPATLATRLGLAVYSEHEVRQAEAHVPPIGQFVTVGDSADKRAGFSDADQLRNECLF